jgi:hypothetical protein
MTPSADPARDLLRHTLATVAYRGGKAVRGAPPSFAAFRVAVGTRTPAEILAHIGDVLDWALSLAKGQETWRDSTPLDWDREIARFFAAAASLDAYLASNSPLSTPAETLFQGPIADTLTHVGQIAMLRRIAGAPMKGENYSKADIAAGRVGPEQPAPRREFD